MGFMDKVKQTASEVAAEAKKGAGQLKDKRDDSQLRKKGDDLAKQLGYLIYKERRKDTPAGDEAERLITEMAELEAQLEAEDTPPAATQE